MPDDARETPRGGVFRGVFTGYGVVSAVLGLIAVVAVAAAAVISVQHRSDTDELAYRTRVLQAAADWTGVLINMTADTVDADLAALHEGTVGALNADFEAVVGPYRKLVQTLKSRTTGQVDSVALETLHHDLPGAPPAAPPEELSRLTSRTDTVLVVATSVSENAGTEQPRTVRWTLRLDVSDVDGRLLISRLEPIR
ncbi:hypothetical protein JDV09_06230 [Mycobacterium sp. Y57]|uniref:hypothetical protein n=1 Tax=Mycolicibacterium xanthum TaxID=2796469 RepID=UPI001C859F62|nr:hypothetical protein [Mycolicibacterium xanthum]MBX7431706.1 hypothetical protein [Mycolicibacterium xanthum]